MPHSQIHFFSTVQIHATLAAYLGRRPLNARKAVNRPTIVM